MTKPLIPPAAFETPAAPSPRPARPAPTFVVRPEDVGRDFDKGSLNLWGLGLKARLRFGYNATFPQYSLPAGTVVEVFARSGTNDAECEYFFLAGDGWGVPCSPASLEPVPNHYPVGVTYTTEGQERLDHFRAEGVARAEKDARLKAYVEQFVAAHQRGENPTWDFKG